VRSSGDTARIELPAAEIPDFINRTNLSELVADLQKLGFIYVTLDLDKA
ncbi:MAG: TIGR00268 family protein, partial [Microcystis sp. LE19-12.2C]|nr:TIGR00268 family protein [Microcystis sp. LE19-12.2C]